MSSDLIGRLGGPRSKPANDITSLKGDKAPLVFSPDDTEEKKQRVIHKRKKQL